MNNFLHILLHAMPQEHFGMKGNANAVSVSRCTMCVCVLYVCVRVFACVCVYAASLSTFMIINR